MLVLEVFRAPNAAAEIDDSSAGSCVRVAKVKAVGSMWMYSLSASNEIAFTCEEVRSKTRSGRAALQKPMVTDPKGQVRRA